MDIDRCDNNCDNGKVAAHSETLVSLQAFELVARQRMNLGTGLRPFQSPECLVSTHFAILRVQNSTAESCHSQHPKQLHSMT